MSEITADDVRRIVMECLSGATRLRVPQRGRWFEWYRDSASKTFKVSTIANRGVLRFDNQEDAERCVDLLESLIRDVVADSRGVEVRGPGRRRNRCES